MSAPLNRFLLDFGELHEQHSATVNYVRTHMHGDTPAIISYLTHLRSVLWSCTSRMDTVQMVDHLLNFYTGSGSASWVWHAPRRSD
jgi:hypothetical protein